MKFILLPNMRFKFFFWSPGSALHDFLPFSFIWEGEHAALGKNLEKKKVSHQSMFCQSNLTKVTVILENGIPPLNDFSIIWCDFIEPFYYIKECRDCIAFTIFGALASFVYILYFLYRYLLLFILLENDRLLPILPLFTSRYSTL